MPLAALARWPKASIDGPSGSPPQSQAKDAQASTYACGPITPNSGKPDGLPVHSFRSLIADLATLARNTVATAIAPNHHFTIVTRPTPIQQKALDLLHVTV